ncbi:tetratricopeptide repeat protein [Piscinibacter terrae]|uniref:Tetratricopeptide repeat protein n=1 Tax=Piscinibacter terrae TaxID=2496871 RepID=A0A3N7HU65_9BURK|nr:tetratricopeptide repeat protein [Albitalea terrae]RQP25343.1 tetratricopeptide repeat protein [Albitalea terrae]
MRSADLMQRLSAVALCLAMAGCASVTDPLKAAASSVTDAVKGVMAPSPSASAPATSAAAAPAKAGSAPVAAAKPLEPEAPVDPFVQRTYDEARRALRSGRMDDAERQFKAISAAHPDFGGPYANLGVIHRQAGKLPEAVTDFEKATTLNPRQPVYFNQLGVTYRMNGQFTKAREAYEKAIELDANYAQAVLNLAILNDIYLWNGPRALELYDRYLALTPGGDAVVTKWIADLKNRKQAPNNAAKKEKA